jgi:hypothetical protein
MLRTLTACAISNDIDRNALQSHDIRFHVMSEDPNYDSRTTRVHMFTGRVKIIPAELTLFYKGHIRGRCGLEHPQSVSEVGVRALYSVTPCTTESMRTHGFGSVIFTALLQKRETTSNVYIRILFIALQFQ